MLGSAGLGAAAKLAGSLRISTGSTATASTIVDMAEINVTIFR